MCTVRDCWNGNSWHCNHLCGGPYSGPPCGRYVCMCRVRLQWTAVWTSCMHVYSTAAVDCSVDIMYACVQYTGCSGLQCRHHVCMCAVHSAVDCSVDVMYACVQYTGCSGRHVCMCAVHWLQWTACRSHVCMCAVHWLQWTACGRHVCMCAVHWLQWTAVWTSCMHVCSTLAAVDCSVDVMYACVYCHGSTAMHGINSDKL